MDEIQILDSEFFFENLLAKFDSEKMNINIYENGENSVKAFEEFGGVKLWKIVKKFWVGFEPLEFVFAEFFGGEDVRLGCVKNFEDWELIYCCEVGEVFYFWTRNSWNKEGSAPAGESCVIWGRFFG